MEKQNKEIDNLIKINNLYRLKIGDMCVDMMYSQNNKSFNECMLNILKQKIKKG